MPELPDVVVFRKYVDEKALHRPIEEVQLFAEEILDGISPAHLQSKTEGHRFESTARHGKYLFVNLDGSGWIVFHFGMTGYFQYFKDGEQGLKHTRALFSFNNGHHLAFVLQRKFGSIAFTEHVEDFVRERRLGPDALDKSLDLEVFKVIIKRTRGNIKSVLMDQRRIAGIGNVYSDEILYQSKILPKAEVGQLGDRDLERVFRAMKEVLNTAIDSQADPGKMPEHYLLPHRKKGGRCPVCGGDLRSDKISGRTYYYCPNCQFG